MSTYLKKLISMSVAVSLSLCFAPALFASQNGESTTITGHVELNNAPVHNALVSLYQSGTANKEGATLLGAGHTGVAGDFSITVPSPILHETILYLVADSNENHNRVATVLGATNVPSHVVVNELTTVATAFAMNQFLEGDIIGGNSVGVMNSASTFRNLVSVETGTTASVLLTSPNGSDTEALQTFHSLGNILAAAASSSVLFNEMQHIATPPCGDAPATLLELASTLARYPTTSPEPLFLLSQSNVIFTPALESAWHGKLPITWTLMLLYGNDDQYLLDGPGRIVIDKEGSIWIANNFAYEESSTTPACAGPLLLRLQPNGEIYPGSPYGGGGISGAGFGIAIDADDNVWPGNFGFSGDGATCTAPARNSVSKFSEEGVELSPNEGENPNCDPDYGGFCSGEVTTPQGMAFDRGNNLWIANLCAGTVTRYFDADPTNNDVIDLKSMNTDAGPFGLATDANDNAWVVDNGGDSVYRIQPNGHISEVVSSLKLGFNNPLGNAVDSQGNVWIANSQVIPIATSGNCDGVTPLRGDGDSIYGDLIPSPFASLIRITPDGRADDRFTGGGLSVPWAVAVDGDDHVWVADFNGKRIAKFCGANPDTWPCGLTTGDAISPHYGYRSEGLERTVVAAVDQSGNVWLSNNFIEDCFGPNGANPGGKTMVQFIGVAAPVSAPVFGPPMRPGEEAPIYCDSDFNGDGIVNVNDLLRMINAWGDSDWYDISGDGSVDVSDLLMLIDAWGVCN